MMRARYIKSNVSAGMGLIEMLIAMLLAVTLIAMVFQVFMSSRHSAALQDRLGRMQENARHAIQTLKQDIRMSGFMGEIQEYWNIDEGTGTQALPATIANECFKGNFRWVAPMISVGGGAGVAPLIPPKFFGENGGRTRFANCIPAENYKTKSDVISVHYAGPQTVRDIDIVGTSDTIYLTTNIFNGIVFRADSNAPDLSSLSAGPNTANYPVSATTYFVRPCTNAGGDGLCGGAGDDTTPALARTVLDRDGVVKTEVVAEGVVDMQVRYGLDSDADGTANRYVDADHGLLGDFDATGNWPNWSRVRSVRVWLLFRSVDTEPGFDANTKFVIADRTGADEISTQAGFRYQLFTTTIALRNRSGDE